VASIQESQAHLVELTGATSITPIVVDPIQEVSVAFLSDGRPGTGQIELVEPVGEESPVRALAQRGGGLHHVCYEVDDLEEQLDRARRTHAVVVRPPQPAAAFQGRRIAWVMTRSGLLIEYLERDSDTAH
jgi:methylmalonyl-CoA/ethylmalonyl-CoA epimerase